MNKYENLNHLEVFALLRWYMETIPYGTVSKEKKENIKMLADCLKISPHPEIA